MKKVRQITIEPELINVHQVRGDLIGIEFLKVADTSLVEGLFLKAKMRGKSEFRFRGFRFMVLKNKDLTYTVEEKFEQISKYDSF